MIEKEHAAGTLALKSATIRLTRAELKTLDRLNVDLRNYYLDYQKRAVKR